MEKWEQKYKERFGCENYPHPEIRDFIELVLDAQRADIIQRIGFLRQWINERPSNRLVTDKDIEEWLNL